MAFLGDYWPSAANIFQALDILFGIIYTVELIVKLVGFKLRFFKAVVIKRRGLRLFKHL